MNKKLSDALNEVRDEFISEAVKQKKKHTFAVPSAIAAVLAVALLIGLWPRPYEDPHISVSSTEPTGNMSIYTDPTGEPNPTVVAYPTIPMGDGEVIFLANYNYRIPTEAPTLAVELESFWRQSLRATLGKNAGTNKGYSPANLYMALCLLAEVTDGEEQLMNLLGARDLNAVQQSANKLWNATYFDYTLHAPIMSKITLANSIWLQENMDFNEAILRRLAQNYYTSSFRGDMGSEEVNGRIAAWLDEQTSGLLSEQTKEIKLEPNTPFALYSTLYYQVEWRNQFQHSDNTEGLFHGTKDSTVTFMNRTETTEYYYVGSNFTALSSKLLNGGMWLILPDAGVTPEELLQSQEYLDLVLGKVSFNREKFYDINLSLPKFDVQTGGSLIEDLKSLGVTNIFDDNQSTLGKFMHNPGLEYVKRINQETRILVDEQGVMAGNFVEIAAPGLGIVPPQKIDFTLDRPFLYVITSNDNLPLFAGIVNEL